MFVLRKRPVAIAGASLLLALLVCGCGKLTNRAIPTITLFKVKDVSTLPALPASAPSADLGTVTVRAAPLLTDEETQELFEANLQLAGLLPVRVEMIHNSGEAMELKRLKFRLQDSSGTEWKLISMKAAVSRILKSNGITSYNPNARKTFTEEFRTYEFNLKTPLTHEERRRHGLIIFLAPQKEPVSSPHGLTLSIQGLAQPVSLKLN